MMQELCNLQVLWIYDEVGGNDSFVFAELISFLYLRLVPMVELVESSSLFSLE